MPIHVVLVLLFLLAAAIAAAGPRALSGRADRSIPALSTEDSRGPAAAPVMRAHAGKQERKRLIGAYDADILRVIDGDTVEARVTIWFGQETTVLVRLAGIDAPELRGACGNERARAIAARDRLATLVEGRRLRLTRLNGDKYFGRVVADLVTEHGSVGARLIAEGLAVPYGGRRAHWCAWAPAMAPP
jgi:endonuclease YncB( thermonuclease family)